jgi:hypothetical protein
MNLVEVWFSIIERQAIHRGTFGSVRDLNAKIRASSPAGTTKATPSPDAMKERGLRSS